ncbi:hypothetical protein MMC06_006458 [Schaereria dolodes]|nr:hypothetical protein [Schaereria dolodes]
MLELVDMNFVFVPRNFPHQHAAPRANDQVSLKLLQSDTIDEIGVAMVKDGLFLGWIRKGEIAGEAGAMALAGRKGFVRSVESFWWNQGGGQCYRGYVTLYD